MIFKFEIEGEKREALQLPAAQALNAEQFAKTRRSNSGTIGDRVIGRTQGITEAQRHFETGFSCIISNCVQFVPAGRL
jgi:hypothetical protein